MIAVESQSPVVAAHSLAAMRFAVAHIRAAVAIVLQLLVERPGARWETADK